MLPDLIGFRTLAPHIVTVAFSRKHSDLYNAILKSVITVKRTSEDGTRTELAHYFDALHFFGVTKELYEFDYEVEKKPRFLTREELDSLNSVTHMNETSANRVTCFKARTRGDRYEIFFIGGDGLAVIPMSKLYPNVRFRMRDAQAEHLGKRYNVYYIENGRVEDGNNVREYAYRCIQSGAYMSALNALKPFAMTGDRYAANDVGACYEKYDLFYSAKSWYEISGLDIAYSNILLLYDNRRVDLDVDDYIRKCQALIDHKNAFGYLYLSYLYNRDDCNLKMSKEEIIHLLDEGLKLDFNNNRLNFEKAYLLDLYDLDYKESHRYYRKVLDCKDGCCQTARYNYALQCLYGRGCEKNMAECLKWLIISAVNGYADSYKKLIEIYETEEGFINNTHVEVWKNIRIFDEKHDEYGNYIDDYCYNDYDYQTVVRGS